METTRWTNPTQPQTLQSSVILLYIERRLQRPLRRLLRPRPSSSPAAGWPAGWGCANERKWGYQLAVAVAVLPFAPVPRARLDDITDNLFGVLIVFAFDILLLALLLHPQSRSLPAHLVPVAARA